MRRRHYAAFVLAAGLLLGVVSSASSDAGDVTWTGVPTSPIVTSDPSTVTLAVSAVDADASATFPATCAPDTPPLAFGNNSITCTATLGDATQVQTTFSLEIDQPPPPPSVTWSSLPSPTAKAGPGGAAVDYTAPTAMLGSTPLTVTCDRASGSTFTIGTTTVTCTATDGTTTGTTSFSVVVTAASGPTLTVPGPQTAEATSASGAPVSYSGVTVSDPDDPSAGAHCAPATGSEFALGPTTVYCSVTDKYGLSASGSFTVTVSDTTPPTLTVPADIHTGATGKTTPVTFTATATDAVDPSPSVSCSPASGSPFPVGSTPVSCTATDNHGNKSAGTFAVVVTDGAPTLSTVAPITVEANGPSGSAVTYTPPTATDTADGSGLLVTCAPVSGATFPLGTTAVACQATNSSGEKGTTSFNVTVQDTTPPSLPTPGSITLTASGSVPATDPHIAAYLALKASDLVDPSPAVANDAPAVFPLGTTTVHFTATDHSGNVTKASGTVTVQQPPAGQPAPSAPVQTAAVDRTPPGDVSGLRVSVSGRAVLLQWKAPADTDFDHVEIDRSAGAGAPVTVYKGAASTFTDRRLTPGTPYRYLVVTFDHTGNESTGVVALATIRPQLLFAPFFGAHLRSPVILRWKPVAKATFYNVQLYFNRTKILSAFPHTTKLEVGSRWTFGKRTYRLKPGTYSWYVWPGLGTRAKPRFGSLEGFSTFTVTRP